MIQLSEIKLVIWDLDDTFWKGTLSEGKVFPNHENISLIKKLTDCGIINSICSKNNENDALTELTNMGIRDFFVFVSINWEPKGERVKNIIKQMRLRPQNVLFLDDNPVNRNEVLFYNKNILVGFNEELSYLKVECQNITPTDFEHKRLHNYKVLEAKTVDQESFSSNEDFLVASQTRVFIKQDCLNFVDRIFELIQRTNQLNYTKDRCSKDDLLLLLNDTSIEKGYIEVSDKYGDYGIVGFYAMKDKQLKHFLFSCRTIGQGVEQYVYAQLGYPHLVINGDVISKVDRSAPPYWINCECNERAIKIEKNNYLGNKPKILFKGPCDMSTITNYLEDTNIIDTEFEYVGERGNVIRQGCHSVHIIQSKKMSTNDRELILKECIFSDEAMFESQIFEGKHDIIFLSSMREPHLGIYRRKGTNLRVVFGLATTPLTEEKNWDMYVNKSPLVDYQQNDFTYEYLKEFSSKYEFEGRTSVEEYKRNLEYLLSHIGKSKLCILLASELAHPKPVPGYENRDYYHKQYNNMIRELSQTHDNLILLDVNKFVQSPDDYTNTINHFKRYIYFKLADEAIRIIQDNSTVQLKRKPLLNIFLEKIINFKYTIYTLKKLRQYHCFYEFTRKMYHIIRK